MAAGVRFIWDRGWEQRVLSEAQARRVLEHAADEARGEIDAAVPVVTGSYKRHFDLGLRVDPTGTRARRIVITEPRWHIIEHGSVNSPAYNTIARGVDASGLEFVRT